MRSGATLSPVWEVACLLRIYGRVTGNPPQSVMERLPTIRPVPALIPEL